MKPLDSLALMLALASSPLNAVNAKDSIKNEIEKFSHVDAKLSTDSPIAKPQSSLVNSPNTVQKEKGTFRASELYWAQNDQEVYLKGQVRVIKLADDDYELVTLDSKEATEKYGDKGLYGAAEIARTY